MTTWQLSLYRHAKTLQADLYWKRRLLVKKPLLMIAQNKQIAIMTKCHNILFIVCQFYGIWGHLDGLQQRYLVKKPKVENLGLVNFWFTGLHRPNGAKIGVF